MPEHVIVSGKPTTRHTDKMKAIELQVFDKSVKIFSDCAGLWAGVRIRDAPAPSAPIESDGAISGLDESGNIVLKAVGVAGIGVKQHDGNTVPAAVRVP